MKSSWRSTATSWACWLLGGGLALALAFGAMGLSPDGVRLRRLIGADAATEAEQGRSPAEAVSAAHTAAAKAQVARREGPLRRRPAKPAGGDSTGSIVAEVIGASTDVDVFLDGQWKGVAPVALDGIQPGAHKLSFIVGDRAWDEYIRVSAGDTTVAACMAPDKEIPGQLVIRPSYVGSLAEGVDDSVFVDGRFVGSGELSVEVGGGYHCVTFLRPGRTRNDFVMLVPRGSVQYISPLDIDPPFTVIADPPQSAGDAVTFRARLSRPVINQPELTLSVLGAAGTSLKTAKMPWLESDGEYRMTVALSELPAGGELRYFFRACLLSGDEIDTPIFTWSKDRLLSRKD